MAKPEDNRLETSAESAKAGLEDRTSTKDATKTVSDGGPQPSVDEIRLQAYYRYLQRPDGEDDELADWLAAESELGERTDSRRVVGLSGAHS